MILPITCGITFARPSDPGYLTARATDHNRSAISVTPERLENKERMADGTLRKFVVATKNNIKVSWTDLPNKNSVAVDKFWAADALRNFYYSHIGDFYVTLNYGDGTNKIYHVMFSDFDAKVTKRGLYTDFYDISMGLEEV